VVQQAKLARISKRTLERVQASLGIVATKQGMTGGWAWLLRNTPNGDLREWPANVNGLFPGVHDVVRHLGSKSASRTRN
jgi:hypothetical protein